MFRRPFIIAGKVGIYLGLAGLNGPFPIIFLSYSELGNDIVNLVHPWPLFWMTFVIKMPFEALLERGPLCHKVTGFYENTYSREEGWDDG